MDPILAELKAQTSWLRLLGLQVLRPLVIETIQTDKQRQVFDLSDGQRTTREIAAAASVGAGSVSRWWASWARLGLMTESPDNPGRWKHIISLADLGVDSPDKDGVRDR